MFCIYGEFWIMTEDSSFGFSVYIDALKFKLLLIFTFLRAEWENVCPSTGYIIYLIF